jgi:hypothetical protein
LTRGGGVATLKWSKGARMGGYDTGTIDAPTATLVQALEQGDAALAASLHTADARLLPPGAPVITGPDGSWPYDTGMWNSDEE